MPQDPKLTPDDMLCFDVYAMQQAFNRLYKPLLAPLGLTYPQYLVMVVLWSEDQMPVGRIGARLGLESSTLTPLIKRLELAGLVTRSRDLQDERKVAVTLTERGRAMETQAREIPRCVEASTGMDSAEIAELRGRLARLHGALTAAE